MYNGWANAFHNSKQVDEQWAPHSNLNLMKKVYNKNREQIEPKGSQTVWESILWVNRVINQ